MRVLSAIGILAWAACVAGGEGKAAKATTATGAEATKKGARLVVIQDKAPLKFEDKDIGELSEGTRLTLIEQHDAWVLVRVTFGSSWFQGWIRAAMTAADSVSEVNVKVVSASQKYVYENQTLPGSQFIEVKVKLEPTEKSPPRVYLGFADEATADLYLNYGGKKKALPYGLWVRGQYDSKHPKFNTEDKQQILLLKQGEALQETYVFVVPLTARERDLELVLKDKAMRLNLKGR
jgi:hypothetical protein